VLFGYRSASGPVQRKRVSGIKPRVNSGLPAAEAGAQRVAGLAADRHGGVVERQPLDGGRQGLKVTAVQREHACTAVRVRIRVRDSVKVRRKVEIRVGSGLGLGLEVGFGWLAAYRELHPWEPDPHPIPDANPTSRRQFSDARWSHRSNSSAHTFPRAHLHLSSAQIETDQSTDEDHPCRVAVRCAGTRA